MSRMLYGLTFVVGVPLVLVAWAALASPLVGLPALGDPTVGTAVAALGLGLAIAGMHGLVVHGRGLPMNAFPPPRFVRRGVYRWMRDPIYVGFGLLVLGVSLATRSPAGLWLVTPVTWLAMAALVFGYERHDLRRRFPDEADAPTLLSIPGPGPSRPTLGERVSTVLLLFGPWLLVYYAVQALGAPPDAFSTHLPFESSWPVVEWMEVPYVSAYLLVPLAVFAARSRSALRTFAFGGWTATVIVAVCWIVIPVVAEHRPFVPSGWSGRLLAYEQGSSAGVAAFPAFHVLWPMLAARAWSVGRGAAAAIVAWAWVALVAVASVATGHHGVVDVVAAGVLYLPVRDPARSWAVIRDWTEAVANSWREWRMGPLRFMNHGLYAGAAGATGVAIAATAAGPGQEWAVAWVAGLAIIGAGTYAQVLEGSSRLLRPFGWYGGLVGGLVGIGTSPLVGGQIVVLFAAFALASPWIQAIGRLRCLVQGCCHGSPTTPEAGIRYRHPRSRVCHIAEWTGVPLLPTPLFSIAGNVVLGLLLARLHMLGAADLLIVGVYFMLSGIARFVEESYRGEPQTPHVAGLRLY
ncbi:MAG: prolipoprotein diacylglyceryl transferase [Gemmatimonadetes bacterium]|nr:prolipoprotein diacylglyceryl transferase [Gemmatimonadota bacterium]